MIDKICYWIKNPKYVLHRVFSPFVTWFQEVTRYDRVQWQRIVMDEHIHNWLRTNETCEKMVAEISPIPGRSRWEEHPYKKFVALHYPEFDICEAPTSEKYDIVIADQVFEHLEYPLRAAVNVYEMLRPGGVFIITTPFLIRYHPNPFDCTRWSEWGMRKFLQEAGFPEDEVDVFSWGNRKCVIANLNDEETKWACFGYGRDLRDNKRFPVVVWAYAQRGPD